MLAVLDAKSLQSPDSDQLSGGGITCGDEQMRRRLQSCTSWTIISHVLYSWGIAMLGINRCISYQNSLNFPK